MKKSVKYIVHCWLDAEEVIGVSQKMARIRTEKWVRNRLRLFREYTLPSLLNQTFLDFEIFLFCGKKFMHITKQAKNLAHVNVIYDYGKSKYLEEIETDFVNITRIDSDDMFHQEVMDEVKDRAILSNIRTANIHKQVIQWNLFHGFITDYFIPRSPFCSHTFPKKIYKNWQELKKQQFMDYKSCQNYLTEKRVCIIRHNHNVTWPRIGKNPKTRRYLEEEMKKRNNFITDKRKMRQILDEFGVSMDKVK